MPTKPARVAPKSRLLLEPFFDGKWAFPKPVGWTGGKQPSQIEAGESTDLFRFEAPADSGLGTLTVSVVILPGSPFSGAAHADDHLNAYLAREGFAPVTGNRNAQWRQASAAVDTGMAGNQRFRSVFVRVAEYRNKPDCSENDCRSMYVTTTLSRARLDILPDELMGTNLAVIASALQDYGAVQESELMGTWESFEGGSVSNYFDASGQWVGGGGSGSLQQFRFGADGTYALVTIYKSVNQYQTSTDVITETGRFVTDGRTMVLDPKDCLFRYYDGRQALLEQSRCNSGSMTPAVISLARWAGHEGALLFSGYNMDWHAYVEDEFNDLGFKRVR
jgi:hypothetical protein